MITSHLRLSSRSYYSTFLSNHHEVSVHPYLLPSLVPTFDAFSRLETCNYSGYKIYPGHGIRSVKTDGKVSSDLVLPSTARTHLSLLGSHLLEFEMSTLG